MSTNSSNDRSSLCAFTFADARKCQMPRRVGHQYLCAFHARKEAQALAGEEVGKDIAYLLSGSFVSACDVSSALGRLFAAVAQGQVKPKTAATLAYLAQTLVQTLPLARHEFINAYNTDAWRDTIRTSYEQSVNHKFPDTESPTPQAEDASAAAAPATKSSAIPAPEDD